MANVDGSEALEHTRRSMTFIARLSRLDGLSEPVLQMLRGDLEIMGAAIDAELERRQGATMDMAHGG